ncbi:MAG TPA: hypothetical protein DCL66_03730 [Gammaproteobacteria bacterium]|nr:hypothetical protein [Gammaproteobacteria bacterium]
MATVNPTVDYFKKLEELQKTRTAPTYDDISTRASELSMLMPQQRRANFYDLATSLSQGLTQQAASGRPSSVGYGLAAGFNLFSEAAQKRRVTADEMQTKLMQMAYTDIEKKRADSKLMQEKMLDSNFDYEIEMLKNNGGYFKGKSVEAAALNLMIQAEKDPALKETPEYKVALAILTKPRQSTVQTEEGLQSITIPGLDLSSVFSDAPAGPAADTTPPAGATFTGKYDNNGQPIFERQGLNGQEYFTR